MCYESSSDVYCSGVNAGYYGIICHISHRLKMNTFALLVYLTLNGPEGMVLQTAVQSPTVYLTIEDCEQNRTTKETIAFINSAINNYALANKMNVMNYAITIRCKET